MNRLYQTLLLLVLVPPGLYAQTQTTETVAFSFQECVKYALENTVAVQNAKIDEQISQAKVKETIGIGLPQIDGSVSLQHNIQLPRFYSTKETAYAFMRDPKPPYPEFLPGLADDDVLAGRNIFQLPSNGNAGITINQLIFNSSYLVGLKAAGTYKDLATRTTEQTEIDLIQSVAKAYYAVLVNNERIALFDNNIARVDSLLRTTRALNENGFAESIDVDRIQVTLNNLKSEKLKFINLQNLSLGLLKFQMNYPMEKPLEVTGTLNDLRINDNLFAEYQEGWDYKNRIEYKILQTQSDLQKLDIKNQYSHSMPNLSAFANLGYSTQSSDVGGLFKTTSDVPTTDEGGPDKWYPYSLIGVTLNVPIFSGLQRNYQVQQAKLSLKKIENSFSSLKQGIDLSIQQNTVTYQNSLETLKSQQENMDLAERVARITKIKYEQGVGSNIEVTDAENSLRAAQVNYYNALYDAILSKIDLDKAYGKINPADYITPTAQN